MRRVSLFLFLSLLLVQIGGAQSLIIIDVHENGDALWTMEKRVPLINQTDIEDWEEFIRTGQGENTQDLEDFRKRIEWFLLSAQKFSSRPMKAENFNLSYDTAKNPSNAFGIVRYSFEWKNFSNRKDGKILIGDSFSEGMVLSQDNVLVINIPEGFNIESSSPDFDKRDGDRLIWDGTLYRNFEKGEPAVVLAPTGINPWFLIIILIVIASVVLALFFKKRSKPLIHNEQISPEDRMIEDLKYEERIGQYLVTSGGQASQSDIIKEIGLSKSRISTILSQMKEKGKIIKIKNGKGNLIRLMKK